MHYCRCGRCPAFSWSNLHDIAVRGFFEVRLVLCGLGDVLDSLRSSFLVETMEFSLRVFPSGDVAFGVLFKILLVLFLREFGLGFLAARFRFFLLEAFRHAFLFSLGARSQFALRIRFLDSFVDVRPGNIRHHTRSENVSGNVSDLCSDVTDFPKKAGMSGNITAPWMRFDISTHPGLLGKIGHIAAKVGNIAGDVLAPGVMANIPGTDINKRIQEADTKRELATRTEAEQEGVTKGLQQEEAKTRGEEAKTNLAKEQNEQNLEKDTEGKITGWKDAQGKLHGLDEEGTPQGVKNIAEATQNKRDFDKSTNGDIVQVTPGKGGASATSTVVHKGDPKVETDLTTRTVGGQEHHILVNKGTGQDIKDLGAFKTEANPAKELAKEKADEEPVIGFDKNGIQRLMPRGQAQKEGLTHLVKSSPKDRADAEQNTAALNDMGAKVKNAFESSKAIDKIGMGQKTLIQSALRGHPDDYSVRMAVSLMAPEAQKYVQDIFSLREAALALPKQTTGGARGSQPPANPPFNTRPWSSCGHKNKESQLP